jgi:hypothetical protein
MRKNSTTAKLTESEILRNKDISKIRYISRPVACQSLRGSHPLAIVVYREAHGLFTGRGSNGVKAVLRHQPSAWPG